MVWLVRGLVRKLIASIPSDFTYHARNSANNLALGGRHSVFTPMTGAPYLRDLDDLRRTPTLDDLAMFHTLRHMSPALHATAHHIVEPCDHPISQRHLRITHSSMKHSDKMFMGMTTSPKNAEDVMEMCAILFGEDFLETHPVTTGNCTMATRRSYGTKRCLGPCAPSASATSRCSARPSFWVAPTRPRRSRRPWRS